MASCRAPCIAGRPNLPTPTVANVHGHDRLNYHKHDDGRGDCSSECECICNMRASKPMLKIFSNGGMYNTPGTLTGPFRDSSDSFHEILIIICRLPVLTIFGISRTEMWWPPQCGPTSNSKRQPASQRSQYSLSSTSLATQRQQPNHCYWLCHAYSPRQALATGGGPPA